MFDEICERLAEKMDIGKNPIVECYLSESLFEFTEAVMALIDQRYTMNIPEDYPSDENEAAGFRKQRESEEMLYRHDDNEIELLFGRNTLHLMDGAPRNLEAISMVLIYEGYIETDEPEDYEQENVPDFLSYQGWQPEEDEHGTLEEKLPEENVIHNPVVYLQYIPDDECMGEDNADSISYYASSGIDKVVNVMLHEDGVISFLYDATDMDIQISTVFYPEASGVSEGYLHPESQEQAYEKLDYLLNCSLDMHYQDDPDSKGIPDELQQAEKTVILAECREMLSDSSCLIMAAADAYREVKERYKKAEDHDTGDVQ
ncbi:hypothetical protein GF351_04250 [Candidatus Woesearchaeota archaeon]|nr:hypothetical protein [Candidatus Woesearchaeota archaeon]